IAFSSEDAIAAWSRHPQNDIELFHCARNEELAVLKEPRPAQQVTFTADGNLLVTSGGRQARLYQLRTAEKLSLPGHLYGVTCVAFNPKNSNLASVGKDKMVRVWKLASRQVVWAKELPGQPETVAYSPDGNLLAAAVWAAESVLLW